jgi:dipeptidyl aminopeptidase/acylaminoacyl peptidase
VVIWQREGLLHRYARWSPTGEWIAVAGDAKTEDRTSATEMWTYWLVSPDGSEIKELGSWPVGGMGAAPQNLDWSPDGKLLLALPSVVVLTTEGQSTDLAHIYEPPSGSVPAHLLPGLVGRDKMLDKRRAWLSHGGQQIAYLGHDGIYVFDRESQTDSLIATYDVVGQMVCRSCLQVRWSADDSLLIAGTQDTAGSRKDMYWGRILALRPEAGSVPELLVEGEDVYLVDVIPDIGGRETSEGAAVDCHSYAGWARYENGDYGFTFRYPATWTLREETGFVSLGQGPVRLVIAYRRHGEGFTGYSTGMPVGDLEDRGIVPALGLEIAKQALVYEDKVKVPVYGGEMGDLVFSIRVDDLATTGYQVIEISETVEDQVDQILGSLEMR